MNAEIVSVGTEILLGDIINTNAAYIARELAGLGIGCYYQTVVGDNPERLRQCLELAVSRADMVITTGGLGPTYDDLTKETVAAHFGRKMVLHQESLDRIGMFFRRIGVKMAENNIKQAYMPEGAVVFANDQGTAPGLALEGKGKIAIMLPGPPREMNAMFERQVKPYLMRLSEHTLVSHSIHFFGIGESTLEHELREFMQAQSNPTVAPYAKEGEVRLRVTARARAAEEAEALIRPVLEDLCARYRNYVYGVDVGSLENALVEALRKRGLKLAVAEAATGGWLAQRLTAVPGSAEVFTCGMVLGNTEAGSAGAATAREPAFIEAAMALAADIREKGRADIACAVGAFSEVRTDQGRADQGSGKPDGDAENGVKHERIVPLALKGSINGRDISESLVFSLSFSRTVNYERQLISSRILHMLLQAVQA